MSILYIYDKKKYPSTEISRVLSGLLRHYFLIKQYEEEERYPLFKMVTFYSIDLKKDGGEILFRILSKTNGYEKIEEDTELSGIIAENLCPEPIKEVLQEIAISTVSNF